MSEQSKSEGPDFTAGVPTDDIPEDGMLAGHVGEAPVLIARVNGGLRAVGAKCTHYGGPLGKGLRVGDTVRCPWHHACFSLTTGEALGPPALDAVPCWKVEEKDGQVFVREKEPADLPRRKPAKTPSSVVIVGGGAAGEAAAETLRREGYDGPVTILSDDEAPPCDRPNLSKDYLAGSAQASWIPLRGEEFYREHKIDLRLKTGVSAIDSDNSRVELADGGEIEYGALLLATGAEPIALDILGVDLPHVHYLRSQADSEAIIAAVEEGAKRAVVIGASFIGLEVAASLRQRELDVHVVAPETKLFERIMGEELGDFVRSLHESKGIEFHLGQIATAFDAEGVRLENGGRIPADLIVVGIGVRPRGELAKEAGLEVKNGVVVNEYLETSAPNVYAAGDIASFPHGASGGRIRVEHWAVAQHQGQCAARNILGANEPYTKPPFFWSQHYDAAINYVGHAAEWDRIDSEGSAGDYDYEARFVKDGRTLAFASIYRDVESLQAEAAMEAATHAL
ncbi:MAG: FAD-dependent oxidoreductase [Gammaproteobacteria bacterium]|nr:FAD-dependent oxidoreductase [Gammaproteobacteria bacterium]